MKTIAWKEKLCLVRAFRRPLEKIWSKKRAPASPIKICLENKIIKKLILIFAERPERGRRRRGERASQEGLIELEKKKNEKRFVRDYHCGCGLLCFFTLFFFASSPGSESTFYCENLFTVTEERQFIASSSALALLLVISQFIILKSRDASSWLHLNKIKGGKVTRSIPFVSSHLSFFIRDLKAITLMFIRCCRLPLTTWLPRARL